MARSQGSARPPVGRTGPAARGGRWWARAAARTAAHTGASLRRDGPDQSAPQLGVFSGNTALETARSSSSRVLLTFHSDFSNGGFFVLNFHGERPGAPRARAGRVLRDGPPGADACPALTRARAGAGRLTAEGASGGFLARGARASCDTFCSVTPLLFHVVQPCFAVNLGSFQDRCA